MKSFWYKKSTPAVQIKTEYKMRFQLLYNGEPLGEFSVLTFEAQSELAKNFLLLFQRHPRLKIFRIVPFYVMQSGDPECNSGFCSQGFVQADSSLIRHKSSAVTACSNNGKRIGTGFYFEMGNVTEEDPVFGYVAEGFEALEMAQRLESEHEAVLGDLEIEFQWWGESIDYISW